MKRLFYFAALLGCVALFAACNSDDDKPNVPEKLEGTRWITSQGEGENRAVVMMEFLDGKNARYTKKEQGSSSSGGVQTPEQIKPDDKAEVTGNLTYLYTYTYSQPDIVLTPVSMDAPALKGKILGGHGSTYSYMSLSTSDGKEFFTAFQDDGSYIWD